MFKSYQIICFEDDVALVTNNPKELKDDKEDYRNILPIFTWIKEFNSKYMKANRSAGTII